MYKSPDFDAADFFVLFFFASRAFKKSPPPMFSFAPRQRRFGQRRFVFVVFPLKRKRTVSPVDCFVFHFRATCFSFRKQKLKNHLNNVKMVNINVVI